MFDGLKLLGVSLVLVFTYFAGMFAAAIAAPILAFLFIVGIFTYKPSDDELK